MLSLVLLALEGVLNITLSRNAAVYIYALILTVNFETEKAGPSR